MSNDPLAEFWNAFYRQSKDLAVRVITGEYRLAVDLEKQMHNSGTVHICMSLDAIHDVYAAGMRFLNAKWN